MTNDGASSVASLLERRHRVFGRHAPLFYERPLHIVRGEGVWLWDADGRRYLDAYNNVPHVGHCHPQVVAAIAKQAATLNTHTRYLHEGAIAYAERLTATFDASLSRVMLTCTGSEANELALRIANTATGAQGVLCTDFAYHGNTRAVAQVGTIFPPPEGIGAHVATFAAPDRYRAPVGVSGQALEDHYVDGVRSAIELLAARGIGVAAMLICPVFANEGLPVPMPGFVRRAVQLVRNAGGLYIADEVQGGFGRSGTHMWAHQMHDVTPDLVTLGKPMGNGHPVAGVVCRADLHDAFASRAMYFNTFGGNPVSCAAANAVLDVLESERLQANALATGAYVARGLRLLADKHASIGDVRDIGLFFAVELVQDRATRQPAGDLAKRVINTMRDQGVLISRVGRDDNILKIRTPMVFRQEHADLLLATLDRVLATCV